MLTTKKKKHIYIPSGLALGLLSIAEEEDNATALLHFHCLEKFEQKGGHKERLHKISLNHHAMLHDDFSVVQYLKSVRSTIQHLSETIWLHRSLYILHVLVVYVSEED